MIRSHSARCISFPDLAARDAWPMVPCAAEVTAKPCSYFFLSHRWLSPEHPDPHGFKLAWLRELWAKLEAFRDELLVLDPRAIGRAERESLCELRLRAAPLMLNRHREELRLWHSGVAPPVGLWLDEDKEPAARALLQWLAGTVDAVLDMHFWIDSWATSDAKHRAACPACSRLHHDTLRSIPDLITNADGCLLLSGFASDELDRGWILFESSAAGAHGRLQGAGSGADFSSSPARIYLRDYACANDEDADLIPRLFVVHECRAEYEAARPEPIFPPSPESREAIRAIEAAILLDSGRGIVADCANLLRVARSERVCGVIDLADNRCGSLIMTVLTEGIGGIVASGLNREAASFPMHRHWKTILKAAIYAAVVERKHDDETAARCILSVWPAVVVHDLLRYDPSSVRVDGRWARELFVTLTVAQFWLASEENLIDITPHDLCTSPLARRPEPRVSRAAPPGAHGSALIVRPADDDELYAIIGKVAQRVGDAAIRLAVGDAVTIEREGEVLRIVLHDGRLLGDVIEALGEVAAECGRPVCVAGAEGFDPSRLAEHRHLTLAPRAS